MLDWILGHLERQVHAVSSAPIPFIFAVGLVTLLLIFLFSLHYENRYRDRLETKDAQMDLLQGQLDKALREYDSDSPNSVNNTTSSSIAGRSLSQEQISTLRGALDLSGLDREIVLDILAEGGCSECSIFQNELAHALTGLPLLKVSGNGMIMGPGVTHQSGLVLFGEGVSEKGSLVNRMSTALKKANIDHKLVEQKPAQHSPDLFLMVITPRKY